MEFSPNPVDKPLAGKLSQSLKKIQDSASSKSRNVTSINDSFDPTEVPDNEEGLLSLDKIQS